MNVLMIGATGSYAGLVLPELKSRGATVRALVRDPARAAAVRDRGADETVTGDLSDPESLRAAAKGMDGVFHINPAFAPHEADLGVAMVHAAQSQGVRKFVFSGVMHPTLATLVNHADKAPVEQALYTSGMDYTVLQPAMFMQMLDGAWASARDQGSVSMPYSKRSRMCYVDYRDVAEAAAVAMTGELLSNGTFELCSPGTFDRTDLADLMARALGRPVQADESSPADAARQLPAGPMREGMTRMMEHYDQHGFRDGNALVLRAALGREPTTVAQYIEELAAGGV